MTPHRQPGRGRLLDLAVLGYVLVSLGGALVLELSDGVLLAPSGAALGESCWVHALFGWSCPFCGMSRSLVALAGGDILVAFGFHPAGPLLALWMLVALPWIVFTVVRRARPALDGPAFGWSLRAVAVVCVVAGLVRGLVR